MAKKKYWVISAIILAILFGILIYINNVKNRNDYTENSSTNKQAMSDLNAFSQESTGSPSTKKTYSKVPDILPIEQITKARAIIKTLKGEIVIKFFSDASLASSNFITLAKDGFYDGLTIHRREEGFVIQGGDPNGNGTGGPGYKFEDEKVTREYTRGIVAMANSGPNTNGSQFFIMLADNPLPKQYTIFGEVVGGIDVVDKIEIGDVMEKVTIE